MDNSLSVHTDNKKIYILVLGEGSTDGLDDTTITVEPKYSVSITKSRKKFVQVYTTMRPTVFCMLMARFPLCLGNISKDFTIDNMKKLN